MEARMSENVRKYPVPPDSKEQSITFLTRKADLVTRVYLTVQKVYIKNKQYNNNTGEFKPAPSPRKSRTFQIPLNIYV